MNQKDTISQLRQEQSELNVLISKGVEFEVNVVEFRTEKKLFGLIKKTTPHTQAKRFKIEEPTLATLDRLSKEWLELGINDEELKDEQALKTAKIIASQHATTCAKIVALAVMGGDYLIPKPGGGYTYNEKELNRLTRLFFTCITPSKLYQITILINAMCNFGDFMNSIRLMSAQRTTAPIRIEGKPQA